MTELFVAIVTAVASFLTTRGWPTLSRRVKDHAALIKELPPGYGDELEALLAAEVRQLVEREADRLDRRMDFLFNLRRGAWIATFTSFGLSTFLTSTWDEGNVTGAEVGTALTLTGIAAAAFVTAVMASSAVRMHQRVPRLQGTREPMTQR